MLGQMQYKILRAIKEGAVSELGVFFKVCKYVIEEDGISFRENGQKYVEAAQWYIVNNSINGSTDVHKLYNLCNRSLQSLIRTSVVVRDSGVPLESRANKKVLRKVQRKNLAINPEMAAYARLEMAKYIRYMKNKGIEKEVAVTIIK